MSLDDLRLTRVPTVQADILIRRPPGEVFQAFADPAITTRFWFTRSSGRMTPGADLRWDWEMHGLSTRVSVKEVDDNRRILFEWNDDNPTSVELRFTPRGHDATFVEVTETGLGGNGDVYENRHATWWQQLTDRCPQNLHDNSEHKGEDNDSEPEIMPSVKQVTDSN